MKLNKKELLKSLREKEIIVGLPVIVKFKRFDGNISKINGTKGTRVIKWEDLLKVLRGFK